MSKSTCRGGWEVEWCSEVPRLLDAKGSPTEDSDFDNAVYHFKDFATIEAARKFAATVYPKDFFGSVRIAQFEMSPCERGSSVMFREYLGDAEYYDEEPARAVA